VGEITTSAGRNTLSYLIKCALPAGHSITKVYNGVSYSFPGQLGVGAAWETGACNNTCQEMISACVMAHINTSGKHINLWLDSPNTLGLGRSPAYPMQESAFFGNIFVSPPKAYFCNGFDWDRGPVAGRIGANQAGAPYVNPFGTNALCKNSCTTVGAIGEAYGSCAGFNNVVTVFRDFDPTLAYNITSVQTGQNMDISHASSSPGAVVDTWAANGGSNQKFFLERVSSTSDSGTYRVHAVGSNLYLDMAGASKGDGGGLIQYGWSGANNQLWNLIQVQGSTYIIANVNSGKLLAHGAGAGAQVTQHGQGVYSDDQMWQIKIAP
jgi:hypothetical protein